ncbi:hypothetical protein I588_01754 [Enterococcus pallens ATCC BAA-351]|uniref:Uncharacterized protein n=1 Tax=Enterococcus pallens ATCC BAA-351 TaxID=1158607 RepID=R2TBR7_9ENTE|nr:hypothetical protein UAU_00342 [Enterococcus pallens ATCC BAA-351]EOU20907.1 hypothetical protein I588_01754 [Enterococcus pallens ATCC BAA-351]
MKIRPKETFFSLDRIFFFNLESENIIKLALQF